MRTAKVSTNAFSQLLSREQTIRFHKSLLGMHPLRLDGVEPGMSAGSRVYFSTKSAEHQVDELVAMAGVEPARTWEKGKHIRHHGFEVRPSFKATGDGYSVSQWWIIRTSLPLA